MGDEKKMKTWVRNPFVWIVIFFVIVILMIVVALVYNYWHNFHDEQITISDINSYDNSISDDAKNELYKILYRIAKINSPEVSSETISSSSANVREGSFNSAYDVKKKLYVNGFIADIPDIEQSYQIYYNNEGNSDAVADCLNPDEYVYPFYLCLSINDDLDKPSIGYLNNILPFVGETESGVAIYVRGVEYTNWNNPFVRIEIDACDNSEIMESGVQTFKKYLTEHYLNLDDYTYKVKNGCDGEAG